MCKIFFAVVFCFTCTVSVFAIDIKPSGWVNATLGADSDLDFNHETSEDTFYESAHAVLHFDILIQQNLSFTTEFLGSYANGDAGSPYSSFNDQTHGIEIYLAYLQWDLKHFDTHLNIGYQQLKLPSATFGNPLFEAHATAITVDSPLNDDVYMKLLLAYPTESEGDMPNFNSTFMVGAILDMDYTNFFIDPYLLYFYIDHDENSEFNWANAANDGYSYVIAGGFAAEYRFTGALALKIDMLYGASNNSGAHYYESKGGLNAILFDYETQVATVGVFMWFASGNGTNLQEHADYGLLPSIGSEASFAPTRLGFRNNSSFGRDAALSGTGGGTKGLGVHIKNFSVIPYLVNTFRAAYIMGTSEKQGAGAPPAVNVPSPSTPHGESGVMTNQDAAIEIDFDTIYNISDYVSVILELAYIVSYFNNPAYDTDIFNAQLTLRYDY